jgi:hypothetical protein
MTNYVRVTKNGAAYLGGSANNIKSPEGDRWFHNGSVEFSLAAKDYVELWVEADDSPGTGFVDFGNFFFTVSLVQAV